MTHKLVPVTQSMVITSASAIRGSSGKAVTAIASATGEFLANVVKLRLTVSL